ncbi:amine oxidase catalytic domain-containing protein [Sarocladium strictum]
MHFSNIIVLACLGTLVPARTFTERRIEPSTLQENSDGACPGEQPPSIAPHKNFWGSLTKGETRDVLALLHSKETGFNLTTASDAGSRDNKVLSVELMMPNKTDVLPLLSSSCGTPTRYALAAVMFGSPKNAYLQEFKVGPLPITNESAVLPYTYVNTREDGKIPVVNPDAEDYAEFNLKWMKEAEDVTKTLWNLTVDDGLQMPLAFAAPLTITEEKVIMWQGFNSPVTSIYDTISLLPLGLYMRSDITGRDPENWKVTGWVYNNVFYPTLDDFRKAVNAPGFKSLGKNVDEPWAHTKTHGDPLPLDNLPPPASIQAGKERFTVDEEENYVTWMDFSFYVSITKDNGVRLYDVRYRGKRVLYELGLDEAIAHYAGIDPVQSGTCYFDSMNGFGPTMISLVNGYDCPSYSHYLNASQTTGETTYSQKDALCMFEIDKGFPIQRHSWAGHTTVTKNIAFNIRAIYTIGNYDYMTTYQFSLDGSVEISVRASGYISSAFYAQNDDYGFKIHDSLSGSLHDHVITFKADFDILGEANSMQKVAIVPSTESYVWSDGRKHNTMKAERSFIETEDDSKINWSPNGGAMYAVVNKDKKNQYGEYPGWRIVPSSGVAYLTVEESDITKNAAHHTTHHMYVTQQKDNELYAVGAYNSLSPEDPQVDFNKYFNGESLVQEDIVVWFNLGMHHMPHTGDLPNTVFSTAHSAITIEPFNYNLGDPSQASTQQVLIKTTDKGPEITRYGAQEATCPIDLAQLNPDLSSYSNTVSVLKYPFDGSKPDRS